MVKFASIVATTLLAGFALGSPVSTDRLAERQAATGGQCSGRTTNGESAAAVCGPVIQPLQQLLRYQSSNIGQSTGEILASANKLVNRISDSTGASEVGSIVNSASNGLVSSLCKSSTSRSISTSVIVTVVSSSVIGVTNTLGGLGVALTNVQPQCRCDVALCLSSLQEANAESSSDQPNAPYACGQVSSLG